MASIPPMGEKARSLELPGNDRIFAIAYRLTSSSSVLAICKPWPLQAVEVEATSESILTQESKRQATAEGQQRPRRRHQAGVGPGPESLQRKLQAELPVPASSAAVRFLESLWALGAHLAPELNLMRVSLCHPGCSTMVRSRLTATSVQAVLLPGTPQ
ncbi:hypothetical protein AAY473_002273 [Plecturocebus cupreus]